MNKVINQQGQEVVAAKKAKLHYEGSFCVVGDIVRPLYKFNVVGAPEKDTPLTVKLIWKEGNETILEFEETEFSAASKHFKF